MERAGESGLALGVLHPDRPAQRPADDRCVYASGCIVRLPGHRAPARGAGSHQSAGRNLLQLHRQQEPAVLHLQERPLFHVESEFQALERTVWEVRTGAWPASMPMPLRARCASCKYCASSRRAERRAWRFMRLTRCNQPRRSAPGRDVAFTNDAGLAHRSAGTAPLPLNKRLLLTPRVLKCALPQLL